VNRRSFFTLLAGTLLAGKAVKAKPADSILFNGKSQWVRVPDDWLSHPESPVYYHARCLANPVQN